MLSTLSVRDDRRSRSKSPGGQGRERNNSRDTRAKSPPRRDQRRPSKKQSESESESESEDDRRRDRRSSKKYYDDVQAEDDRRRKSSKKYSSEEEETRHKSSRSKKYYDDDSDGKRTKKDKKFSRRRDESEESDRRKDKSKKSTKKKVESESESSTSEDINISTHRKSKSSSDRKDKKDDRSNGRQVPPPAPAPMPTVYPPAPFPPPQKYGYPAPPPGYLPDPRVGYQDTRHMSYVENSDPRYPPPNAYLQGHSEIPDHQRTHSISAPSGRYAEAEKFQYAEVNPNIGYKSRDPTQYVKPYNQNGPQQLVQIAPEKSDRREKKAEKKYVEDKYDRRDKKYHDDRYGSPPEDMTTKMSLLAVGGLGAGTLAGSRHNSHDGGRPPASPLLEAYKGTYQSISPMPSALVLANHKNDSDISDLEMSDSESSQSGNDELKKRIRKLEKEKHMHEQQRAKEEKEMEKLRKGGRDRKESDVSIMMISPTTTKKKVSFYDPIPDAKRIAAALQGTSSAPNTKTLIRILPDLSSDDLFALRAEYKNHAKIGGQGINMSKHIKMRVPGNLGKAVYATALGRWESEAYWANSWYQGGASRRELLIESLMGRSNSDIHEIKNCFKDKRYNDNLEKCMKAELKADKFRVAILLALEERRMAEGVGLDIDAVQRDVTDLYRALTAREGGETAMIQIIVVRSDAHLREVLRVFEAKYGLNFAREMITKSRNLVGETLAHILNGALNRAMRDALLLHQAISETAPGKERAELLISRLVRLHWEPKHLERVKIEYERRYKIPVDVAIKKDVVDLVKSEEARQWGEFCIELSRSSSR